MPARTSPSKTRSASPAGKPGLGKPVFWQGVKSATRGGGDARRSGEEAENIKLTVATEFLKIGTWNVQTLRSRSTTFRSYGKWSSYAAKWSLTNAKFWDWLRCVGQEWES